MSRARQSLRREAAREIKKAKELLEAAASDKNNPKVAAKAKQALTILRHDT